jgi:small-conductance mechanosensitive channel
MKTIEDFIRHDPMQLIRPLVVLAVTLGAGLLLKSIVFKILRRWVAHSKSHVATIIMRALDGPFMMWVLILGLHLATQSSELPHRWTTRMGQVLLILWIISLAIMLSRLLGNIIRFYGNDIPGAMPVTTLTQNLAQIGVSILALLVLLNLLGIPIAPILTALGVGGLAVALALQDTLSNLFAGFYVAIARQVRLSDYIKLSTGEEGYVTDITWRSTTIRTLNHNMIIIPNAKLAQAVVTNYYLPEKRLSIQVPVSVGYDSDIELVERVLLEEATNAAGVIPGMLADPAPTVSFEPGFGDSALGFTVGCHVQEFANQFPVRQQLRKRILLRFRQEKIDMPFPTRTVYLHEPAESPALPQPSPPRQVPPRPPATPPSSASA